MPNLNLKLGKHVVKGEYEIDNDMLVMSDRLKGLLQDAEIWAERIGFNAVYSVGGVVTRRSG
jgi:hypothetical protein